MIGVAALWIVALLLIGGFALDRVLTALDRRQFRQPARIRPQLDDRLVGDRPRRRSPLQPPARRPALRRALFGPLFPDQRRGRRHLPVALAVGPPAARRRRPHRRRSRTSTTATNSRRPAMPSRCASPSATRSCPDRRSAGASRSRNRARRSTTRSDTLRSTLFWSFTALGVGLLILAALQTFYGLWPLRRVRREVAVDPLGRRRPASAHEFPDRNPAADRGDQPAARAQRGAGRGSAAPRRQPRPCAEDAADRHHQRRDRARARPRRHRLPRGAGDAPPGRSPSRPRPGDRPPRLGPGARHASGRASRRSQRAVDRLYEDVTVDIAGDHQAQVRVERQDLDEMLGNLVENAAKYGGGRVFVTVEPKGSDGRHPGRGRRSRASRQERAASCSPAARGSTPPASPAPASASPSSATSPRSTAARSASRKARTSAACWRA